MAASFLRGAGVVCLYFFVAASLMLSLRKVIRIPDELFRKLLHSILLVSYIPFVFAFDVWWQPVLLAAVLEALIYPALAWAEGLKAFSAFVNERSRGEFKQSLLLAFSMLAVCIAVCWGWLGDRYMVLACMYAWGVGDAFAALVGKRFGRHKIRLKHTDGKKSAEGSLAMFVSSFLAVMIVLALRGGIAPASCVLIAASGAAAATAVELFTAGGMDTVTCPTAAMCVILPLTALLGGL